eukprot:4104571-Amphidinium_carterae.1
MPDVATWRDHWLRQCTVDEDPSPSTEDRSKRFAFRCGSFSFGCEQEGLIQGALPNRGFPLAGAERPPICDAVLLPRSPDSVDHGEQGNRSTLPRFRSSLLGQL